MVWQDEVSQQYQKILQIPPDLTELLEGTEMFKKVLRGYPEDPRQITRIAVVYFNGIDFIETMGDRSKPEFVYTTIGLLSRGTKTKIHDEVKNNSIYLLSRFDSKSGSDPEWNTVKGNVRNTFITNFKVYPEQRKGKNFLTTAVIQLKHDVRW